MTFLIVSVLLTSTVFSFYLLITKKALDAGWILAVGIYWDILWRLFLSGYVPFAEATILLIVALGMLVVVHSVRYVPVISKVVLSKAIVVVVAFLVYAWTSVWWSPNQAYGQWKMELLLVRGLFVGLAFYVIYLSFKCFSWKPVIMLGTLGAGALLMDGVEVLPGRIALYGHNPIWAARGMMYLFAVTVWNVPMKWWLRLPLLGIASYSFYMTQSRGPLAAFIIASGIVFVEAQFLRRDVKFALRIAGIMLLVALLSGGVLFGLHGLENQPLLSAHSRMAALVNPTMLVEDPNLVARLYLFGEAITVMFANPLLGAGLGGIGIDLLRAYPHNIVLEIGAELGIAGLLIWTAGMWVMIRATRNNAIWRVLLLQSIAYALFSGDLGVNYEWLLVGIAALAMVRLPGSLTKTVGGIPHRAMNMCHLLVTKARVMQ